MNEWMIEMIAIVRRHTTTRLGDKGKHIKKDAVDERARVSVETLDVARRREE